MVEYSVHYSVVHWVAQMEQRLENGKDETTVATTAGKACYSVGVMVAEMAPSLGIATVVQKDDATVGYLAE